MTLSFSAISTVLSTGQGPPWESDWCLLNDRKPGGVRDDFSKMLRPASIKAPPRGHFCGLLLGTFQMNPKGTTGRKEPLSPQQHSQTAESTRVSKILSPPTPALRTERPRPCPLRPHPLGPQHRAAPGRQPTSPPRSGGRPTPLAQGPSWPRPARAHWCTS